MGRRGRRAIGLPGLALGLTLLLQALGPTAAAQQDPDDDPRYRGILADAVSEYNAGNFAEARALFRQANELHPNARTLRGMGMASFELKEYVDALRYLRAALASKAKPLTDAQRASTDRLIRRANAFVGRYTLTTTPADVEPTVRVDGAPATLEPDGTLVLDLGRHDLAVGCAGCQPVHRALEVRGGEEETLTIALSPATSAPPAEAQKAEPAGEPPGEQPHASRAGAWWLLGGAGVAAAATVGTGLWWKGRNDEIAACDAARAAGSRCDNRDTLVTQRNLAVGLTAVLGAATVGLAVVGALRAAGGDDDAPSDEAGLRCAPSLAGGACILRF